MVALRCGSCDRTFTAGPDVPWRCTCGHALDFDERHLPEKAPPEPGCLDTRPGLWTFSEFLPLDKGVTLGEGMTPLVPAPEWDATMKLEYVSPTGSFKDRGAALSISRAVANGVEDVVEDSSGNAGHAIATYAARAGLEARIFVPEGVKTKKRQAIARTGAEVVTVSGTRADVTSACLEAVESGSAWYASHAWDPAFYAGTATIAYEIALQRDWTAPDAVVVPVGHGTLYLGAYRGFRNLLRAGWIETMPRLFAAQAAGYAPFVESVHGERAAAGTNETADGIQIESPARFEQVLDAIDETDGDVIAVDADVVRDELKRLHQAGFYTEPTCAVAPAALDAFRDRGMLSRTDDVVVPLTGSGLKG